MEWLARLVGARSRQEIAGLVLDAPAWEVTGLTEPAAAFAALPTLAPEGAYLFLEGGVQGEDLRSFLDASNVSVEPRPALGTIWPAAPYYCVAITQPVIDRLVALTAALPHQEVCWHMHVFAGGRILLSGHDAFSDPFFVSADVPEECIRAFCSAAGPTVLATRVET